MSHPLRVQQLSVGLAHCALLASLILHGSACPGHARAELIPGIDDWARAVTAPDRLKWGGARVAFPEPSARPRTVERLDATLVPLSVHGAAGVSHGRLVAVLAAAEAASQLWAAAGLFVLAGDGGEGGTPGYDIYVINDGEGAGSGVDATQPVRELDGARAFARIDQRLPLTEVAVCTAEALADALLRELDPAERAAVRHATAAYFAWLATGEEGCALAAGAVAARGFEREQNDDPRELTSEVSSPFEDELRHGPTRAAGFAFLRALGARQDQNRGLFIADMWQLSRQRTWEGQGLRGSPQFFEAVQAALGQDHEKLEQALGELSDRSALLADAFCPHGELRPSTFGAPAQPRASAAEAIEGVPCLARTAFSVLPLHAPVTPPLWPLEANFVRIDIDQARPGERLVVWLRGEYGVRWVLSATRVDAAGRARGRVSAPIRDEPNAELHVELGPDTAFVLVSVTNAGKAVPTWGAPDRTFVRSAQLLLDRRTDF